METLARGARRCYALHIERVQRECHALFYGRGLGEGLVVWHKRWYALLWEARTTGQLCKALPRCWRVFTSRMKSRSVLPTGHRSVRLRWHMMPTNVACKC